MDQIQKTDKIAFFLITELVIPEWDTFCFIKCCDTNEAENEKVNETFSMEENETPGLVIVRR